MQRIDIRDLANVSAASDAVVQGHVLLQNDKHLLVADTTGVALIALARAIAPVKAVSLRLDSAVSINKKPSILVVNTTEHFTIRRITLDEPVPDVRSLFSTLTTGGPFVSIIGYVNEDYIIQDAAGNAAHITSFPEGSLPRGSSYFVNIHSKQVSAGRLWFTWEAEKGSVAFVNNEPFTISMEPTRVDLPPARSLTCRADLVSRANGPQQQQYFNLLDATVIRIKPFFSQSKPLSGQHVWFKLQNQVEEILLTIFNNKFSLPETTTLFDFYYVKSSFYNNEHCVCSTDLSSAKIKATGLTSLASPSRSRDRQPSASQAPVATEGDRL